MLSVNNLTKYYKDSLVIDDISFHVNKGDICGIIGLNGAGKTTIIKAIAALLKNFSGNISVNGINQNNKFYKNQFSFLPELFSSNLRITGFEYIDYMRSLSGSAMNNNKVIKMCNMLCFDTSLLKKNIKSYSKGTLQKLGLIENLTSSAPLLILDEPMSGLDPLARIRLQHALIYANNEGKTIFLSTHMLSDVEHLCANILVINRCKVQYAGTPELFMLKNNSIDMQSAFLKEINV